MTKICENCLAVEVPEDKDVCEDCVENVMKQDEEAKEVKKEE